MAFPTDASVVVLLGSWWDESTRAGMEATITATPVPAGGSGAPANATPNLTDLANYGWIKSRSWVTKPLASGLYALPLIANDDPDLSAFGGYLIAPQGEPSFLVNVSVTATTIAATPEIVSAITQAAQLSSATYSVAEGDQIQVVRMTEAAVLSAPAPQPPSAFLTESQINSRIATAVAGVSGGGGGAPSGGAGGVLGGTYPNPSFAVDMATQAELNAAVQGIAIPGAVGNNTTDDTAAINTALSTARTAGGGLVRGTPGATYRITAPLVIGSNTILDMTGCRVRLDVATQANVLNNPAVGTVQRTISNAAITSGAATLTASGAAFTSADIGRSVVVAGAGVAGGPLCARITAVGSGTSATVDTNAGTTVSAAAARVYDRDRNIEIIGGTWDLGNNQNGPDDNGRHGLRFRRVDGLTIRSARVVSTGGKYAINAGDVTSLKVYDPDFACASDGVHVQGPADGVTVRGVTGKTGDDTVALGCHDYSTYNDVQGAIAGVVVEDTHATTSANLVKCFSRAGLGFDGVTIRNTSGLVLGDHTGVTISTDSSTEQGQVDNVLVDGVNVRTTGSFLIAVQVAANSRRCIVRNVTVPQLGYAVQAGGSLVQDYLEIDSIDHKAVGSGFHVIDLLGTVRDLIVSKVTAALPQSASIVFLHSSTVVNRLNISKIRATAPDSGCVVDAQNGGATLGRAIVSEVDADHLAWIFAANITTEVHLSDVVHNNAPGLVYVAGSGNVTVRNGSGIAGNSLGTTKETSGQLALKAPDYPIDVATINNRATGDRAYNSNGSRACGVGPVMWTGSAWQNLATAATYAP